MDEQEGASTRRVLKQAAVVLDRELNVLYADRRDHMLMISELERSNSQMRDSVDYANERYCKAQENADFTLGAMLFATTLAFMAIGYAVYVS